MKTINMLKPSYIKPYRLSEVEEYNFNNEILLYSINKEMGISLNSSAKAIWELCDGKHTLTEISHELGQSFGVSDDKLFLDELLSDVIKTVSQLYKLEVLEFKETSSIQSTQKK